MIEEKTMIHDIFRAALKEMVRPKGKVKQSELADAIDISKSFLNDLIHGRRYGKEETRREIAAALNIRYDDFLDIGKVVLGLKDKVSDGNLIFIRDELDKLIISNIQELDVEDKKTILRLILRCSKGPKETSHLIAKHFAAST